MALAKYSSPLDYTLVKWRDGQSTSAVCTSNSTPPLQQRLDSIIAVARLSAAACLSAAASQRAVSSKVSGFPKHEKNESEGVNFEQM